LNGLSHRDAAQHLGISEKTVDEHMMRGLKRLSDELRQERCRDVFRT
jgi:DNA-directed RNA polymerase specialized sigma24 family protein